jgi:outer membrane murein-binding lipoprotein Lpp
MGRPKKEKLTKEQKWVQANQEFVDGVAGLSVADLNSKLSTLSKNAEEVREGVEAAMEPGQALYEAKHEYDQLKAPFNDAKKLLKQKTKFVYKLLKDKGGK